MANTKVKNTEKPAPKAAMKINTAKKESLISSNVASFVSQATYNQRVQKTAYQLFLQRGGVNGDALTDWFEAEKIISSQA